MSSTLKAIAVGGGVAAVLALGTGVAVASSSDYPSTPAPAATTAPAMTTAPAKAAAPAKALAVTAALTPAQEVPKPAGKLAAASGSFTGSVTPAGKLTYTLTFKGLSGPATASHLHQGKPGTSGPVVVPLCPPGCRSPLKGTKTVSKSFLAAMKRGDAYVNVHTQKNPGGEIRGLVKVR